MRRAQKIRELRVVGSAGSSIARIPGRHPDGSNGATRSGQPASNAGRRSSSVQSVFDEGKCCEKRPAKLPTVPQPQPFVERAFHRPSDRLRGAGVRRAWCIGAASVNVVRFARARSPQLPDFRAVDLRRCTRTRCPDVPAARGALRSPLASSPCGEEQGSRPRSSNLPSHSLYTTFGRPVERYHLG